MLGAAIAPATAHAARTSDRGGGASFAPPKVTRLACADEAADGACVQGTSLKVRGANLESATAVAFLGGRGKADDQSASPVKTSARKVVVTVPTSARSGRIRVLAGASSARGPRVKVAEAPPVSTTADDGGVFPIRGKHDYGTFVNRFGGGRNHQGQDVFAKCGTKLVAALTGTVTINKFQDRAGNYVVIKAKDGTSQAYMHLRAPAEVTAGDRVKAGERIGEVGDTGDASGCHLHFELWTAPGWYEGGSPIDPLPSLKSWDKAS